MSGCPDPCPGGFWIPSRRTLHSLFGQPMWCSDNSTEVLPDGHRKPPVFQLHCHLYWHWAALKRVWLCLLSTLCSGIHSHPSDIQKHSFSALNSDSPLDLSSWEREREIVDSYSFLWPFVELTPLCPDLSCTGELRTRPSTLDVASLVLNRGEGSLSVTCCQYSSSCIPGYP